MSELEHNQCLVTNAQVPTNFRTQIRPIFRPVRINFKKSANMKVTPQFVKTLGIIIVILVVGSALRAENMRPALVGTDQNR